MAINLTTKYSDKVAERFKKASITDGVASQDYDFVGAKTVKVYSVDTVPLQDYSIGNGLNSYGTAYELGDTVQELTMSEDKCFRFTIDKGNDQDQLNIKAANKALKREIDERVTPYIDKYRLAKWSANAGCVRALASAPIKNSIAEQVMDCTADLDNKLASGDRTMFIKASYYKYLKLMPEFIGSQDLEKSALVKGQVGEIDGMKIIKAPDSWLPEGVYWLITTKNSILGPVKLQDYKIHRDPPGLSGNLVEGRIRQDAYVLGARADGVLACINNSYAIAAPTVTNDSTNSKFTMVSATSGVDIVYTTDGSDPRFSESAVRLSGNNATVNYATLNNAASGTGGKTVRAAAVPNSNTSLFHSTATDGIAY